MATGVFSILKDLTYMCTFMEEQECKNKQIWRCYFSGHLDTGFYDKFMPLNEGDIKEIRKQIELLLKKPKYDILSWKI